MYSGVENTIVYVPGGSAIEYVPSSSATVVMSPLGAPLIWIVAAGRPSLVLLSIRLPRIVPGSAYAVATTPRRIAASTDERRVRAMVDMGAPYEVRLSGLLVLRDRTETTHVEISAIDVTSLAR